MDDITQTSAYDYHLPDDLIAKYPSSPRGTSRLLVYFRETQTIVHTNFRQIFDYLPKNSTVFLNNTMVIKARMFGHKKTGAKLEIFFIKEKSFSNYEVMIKGRIKIGDEILLEDNYLAKVVSINEDGTKIVNFFYNDVMLDINNVHKMLEKLGHIPIPPYIGRSDEKSDEQDYQSVFAKNVGSIAAPTASLHFNNEQFYRLTNEYKTHQITLHVGLGTFKNVNDGSILEHKMHKEWYSADKQALASINSSEKILSIGTTSARTVEYLARGNSLSGECDIFLNVTNPPQRVDYLLTNFHLPKSTLIMLVASMIGYEQTMQVYKEAVEQKYRFFSYGDAMLII